MHACMHRYKLITTHYTPAPPLPTPESPPPHLPNDFFDHICTPCYIYNNARPSDRFTVSAGVVQNPRRSRSIFGEITRGAEHANRIFRPTSGSTIVRMYVCMYVCVCMYVYMYVCMYVCIHACMFVWEQA